MNAITQNTQRIDLPLAELIQRRNVVVKECFLLLHDKYMEYKVVANYESNENDEGLWTPYKCNYKWTRLKTSISSIDMFKCNREGLWGVNIEFHGISKCSCWDFKESADALAVYNQLKNYHIQ